MLLKLNNEFLQQYHIKNKSKYNDNYYRLPFVIECDGNEYDVLHITCDEFANEYNYSLCYELEDNTLIDDRYVIPSFAEGDYVIDLMNYSKTYDWY